MIACAFSRVMLDLTSYRFAMFPPVLRLCAAVS
jgi:hypothetical protein